MAGYFLRRLLLIVPTFVGITLLVFAVTRVVPGGPIERMMNQQIMAGAEGAASTDTRSGGTLSAEQLAELERYYGFDQPILASYGQWLWKVMKLDLGVSYAVCIPLGVAKALRHNSLFDNLSSTVVFVGYAVPAYVVAIALISAFAAYWEWFPLGGFVGDDFDDLSAAGKLRDIAYHAVLPLLAYLSGSFAVTTFMMKNALMDHLSADYLRTAIAKGLSFPAAVRRHALRNSLIPIATSFGQNLSVVLGGSFLIETIFNIDGIGLLGYEAVLERDYPVVLGILVLSSLLYLVGNILSDLCVAWVDPRIRFEGR